MCGTCAAEATLNTEHAEGRAGPRVRAVQEAVLSTFYSPVARFGLSRLKGTESHVDALVPWSSSQVMQ